MGTKNLLTRGHVVMPLSVTVDEDTISGQYKLTVAIAGVEIHIERPETEQLARYRAEFLFLLWVDRLLPVYQAGINAATH